MNTRLLSVILLGGFLCAGFKPAGAETPETNLELMGRLIEERIVTDSLFMRHIPEEEVLLNHQTEDSPLSRFVSSHLSNALIRLGKGVSIARDPLDVRPVLSWIAENVSIRYADPERPSFFSPVHYTRRVAVRLNVRITDGQNGRVRWSGPVEAQKSDTLSAKDLPFVEQGGAVFGHPDRPDAQSLRDWFEPAALIGVAGLIVYLFYSIRS